MKCSASRIAGFLRSDGSPQAIFRMGREHLLSAVSRRGTEIHVLVPLRHAERDALVELIFGKTLGRRVHHADELVVVAVFFVEQGRGMLWVESESCFDGVPVVREVIHLLRNFGMENLESVGQSGVVIRILF